MPVRFKLTAKVAARWSRVPTSGDEFRKKSETGGEEFQKKSETAGGDEFQKKKRDEKKTRQKFLLLLKQ